MGTSETLRSVIDAGRSSSKRLDELSTARVIGQTALKVHAEQQKAGAGKSIGPITPASVEIGQSGDIKLELGQRGSTLAYTAPEALTGTGDRRSDVFSLGVLMWEALTQQRLFDAINEAAVKEAVSSRAIAPPAEHNANIPAELSAICMKALARNPADRYQSTKVMAVEIEEVLSDAGYADNNDQIAAFLGELAKAKSKSSLPAPHVARPITPAQPTPVIPKVTSPSPVPSVLAAPPPPEPAPAPAAAKEPAAKPAAQIVEEPPAAAKSPPAPTPVPAVPMPPVLPVAASSRQTMASSVPLPASALGRPPAEPAAPPPPAPASVQATNGAIAAETPARADKTPHPAAIVSLPPIPGGNGEAVPRRDPTDVRKSGDMLGNWAWQTDSINAIQDDDDDYAPAHNNRKILMYVIGGGVALAMLVTIITLGFGHKPKEEPPPVAKRADATNVATTEPAKADPPGSAAPAIASGSAQTAPAGSGEPVAPGSAEVPAGSGSAQPAVATPDTTKPDTTKPDTTAPDTTKPDTTKPDTTKPIPDKAAPIEPPKPVKPAKVEPPKTVKVEPPKPKVEAPKPPKPRTDKIAKVEPKVAPKPDKPKADVETAYRTGIQQFARGDTSGALTSLRTALAGNPNFAPTWRGLGLVFEKLGEKDQARASFRRYLQLSPNAADAEQIRGRLEHLGS